MPTRAGRRVIASPRSSRVGLVELGDEPFTCARATRERIVPTGTSQIAAASAYEQPTICVSTNARALIGFETRDEGVERVRRRGVAVREMLAPLLLVLRARRGGGARSRGSRPRKPGGRSRAATCARSTRRGTAGARATRG